MAELVDNLLDLLVFTPESSIADDLLEPGNKPMCISHPPYYCLTYVALSIMHTRGPPVSSGRKAYHSASAELSDPSLKQTWVMTTESQAPGLLI